MILMRMGWVVPALLVLVGEGFAQDPDSVYFALRAECSQAATVVAQGPSHPEYSATFERLSGCPERIEHLDVMWENATEEDAWRLFQMTASVRSLAAYELVRSLLEDGERPSKLRVAALGVLGSYLRPGLSPRLSEPGALMPDTLLGTIESNAWRFSAHAVQGQTAWHPLPDNASTTIRMLVQELASVDPDPIVRGAATALIPLIEGQEPVPFSPDDIEAAYVCENLWRISNEGKIGGWISWRIGGTAEFGQILVPPGEDIYFRTQNAGTLRVSFGFDLIAEESHGATSC